LSKVLVDAADGITTITFNRPEKKNALDADCWVLLDEALRTFEQDDAQRVLVLTGAGGEFTSGADLSGGITGEPEKVASKMREVADIQIRLHDMPKPTVARVDGVAVGVGMSLALCCDLIAATERSRFGAVFVRQGLNPDGGLSWMLPRLIGPARAKELTLLARLVHAPEAERMGLINAAVPGVAELDAVVGEWVEKLRGYSPVALAETKALLNETWDATFASSLEREAASQLRSTAARAASDAAAPA